jgi:predicted transcriptional regulator
MDNILLKQKHAKIIVALRDATQNWYISTLAKASGTTYVHTCNFLTECENLGITSSEKHGKIKIIKLTEKGAKLADMLISISSLVNVPQQQKPAAEPKPI